MVGGGRLHYALRMVAGNDAEQMRDWQYAIGEAGEPLHFPSLAEIAGTLPPVRWLWHGWIRGHGQSAGAFQGTGSRTLSWIWHGRSSRADRGPTVSRWNRSEM